MSREAAVGRRQPSANDAGKMSQSMGVFWCACGVAAPLRESIQRFDDKVDRLRVAPDLLSGTEPRNPLMLR
jgi:hypothetical protein